MKNRSFLTALIVLITFAFTQFFSKGLIHFLLKFAGENYPKILPQILLYLIWLGSIFIAFVILYRLKIKQFIYELGLNRNILEAALFTFIATLPMMLGYFFVTKTVNFSLTTLIYLSFLPAFMEETLFRGFVFGQLFKRARWGFIPAVLVNALFFALGHMGQSRNAATVIGILLLTFLGGGWFAWLYIEWDENLWVPIGLHFFMNFWWGTFKMGENALGGGTANLFRVLTIILTIAITVLRAKRGKGLVINRTNLWRRS